jgi:hypothetical protein
MTIWSIARGAGLAALVLLTVATSLGALVSGGGPTRPEARVVAQYAHRVAASLGLAVLGLHLTMILADSFAHVGWVGALVPFTSQYRPLWVGLGSLAAYTFLLVGATGFARGRMAGSAGGAAVWRTLHGAAYAGWAMAILHGLRSGTDSSLAWVRLLYLACLLAVVGSVVTRVAVGSPKARIAAGVGVSR